MASESEENGTSFKSEWCVAEEYLKIVEMIEKLKIPCDDISAVEKAYEDFWLILSNFQEQPHLLDAYLDRIMSGLVGIVLGSTSPKIRVEAFKYIHTVMKVRGYKRAVRYMSHEVGNLEPIMKILESADVELDCWQASYVLLVWLSILVLTPFPLSYFDSSAAVEGQLPTMMLRIDSVIKKHLMSNDMFCVSSNLAANFYKRIDVKEILSPFFDWLISVIVGKNNQTIFKVAAMSGAAAVLKLGDRGDLIEPAKKLLTALLEETNTVDKESILYRKYRSKLIQRIGLTFLKKCKVKWRYEKGYCSLLQNLTENMDSASSNFSSAADTAEFTSSLVWEQPPDEQFEEDVLECLSEVINILIEALEDSDTVVRWSAAKGIGRMTERLTQQMGDMVLSSVLDIFSEKKNHFSWHGGCLALAQMASRSLLPKPRLAEIVKLINLALMYDEPKRFSSVGENVRDAACYVFWAFARAFNEEDLKPLSNLIMTNLLLVALFDREVHCRRAASAAFQEYVGRCSSIPDGIAIMTEADYMSVGIRKNAYLDVSVQIAKIGGFTKAMIEHLIANRLCHWDAVIRDLAAKALNLLSQFEPLFVASFFPLLFERVFSDALTERLGATPAVAEIIHGLSLTGSMHEYVDDLTLKKVKSIIPKYRLGGNFRGIGGDMMKGPCCRYIWKCSEAKLKADDVAEDWLSVIQECVYNTDPHTREAATLALHSFLENYFSEANSDRIVAEYIAVLSVIGDDGDFRRACAAAVFCNIPSVVLENRWKVIIPELIKCTQISTETAFFSESRCMAIKALLYILTNADVNNVSKDAVHEVFCCFLNALEDYTRNKKGDIGSHVRFEAIMALFSLTKFILTHRITMLEEIIVQKIITKLMQLALEPQDKVRICAGEIFGKLIYSEPEIPYVPKIVNLKKIFQRNQCTDVNWWKEGLPTYYAFIEVLLLMEPHYTHHILVGFMMAIGGVSEHSVLNVGAILFEILEDLPFKKGCDIARATLKVLMISRSVEHLSMPVLNFFNHLLDCGALNTVLLDPNTSYAADILSLIKKERGKTRDFNKTKAVISILSGLSMVKGEVGLQAFEILSKYLNHSSIAVRSATATRMFEAFSLLDDNAFPGCNMQVVMQILAETKWKGCKDDYADPLHKICEEIAKANMHTSMT